LEISVRAHPFLRRAGDDLEMDVPLTVLEAMRGTSITVPTPTGDVKVKIPAGVQPGQRLRMKGRGVQKPVPGHLYLVLLPTPPKTSDPEVLIAAQRLEEAYVGDLRGHLRL
jgi:DnaJ-class molecular chaperone